MAIGKDQLEGLGGLDPDEALWPQVREGLVEGVRSSCENRCHPGYAKATARAKMCGLWDKARADPRWAAEGFLAVRLDGRDELLEVYARGIGEMGLNWARVGPWVLDGWMSRLETVCSSWPSTFDPPDRNTPEQDRPGTWLVCAAKAVARGWDGVAGGERSPLGGSWELRLAKLMVGLGKKAEKSAKKKNMVDQEQLARILALIPEWGSASQAMARFEALVEAEGLGKSIKRAPRSSRTGSL